MKYKGLTLVELIVAVAIIAVLATVTFPSLQSSRRKAKSVLCGSNIRQIMLGLSFYESENRSFPFGFDDTRKTLPDQGYAGYRQFDKSGWWWFNFTEGYFDKTRGKKQVLTCPANNMKTRTLEYNILSGNYGVNQSICKDARVRASRAEFVGTPLQSSDILHPAKTLLIADSGYSLINWWHVTKNPPVKLGHTIDDMAYIPAMTINNTKKLWPGKEQDAIAGRHPNKKVNIGFVDGHIEFFKADKISVELIHNGYNNRSPLWSP